MKRRRLRVPRQRRRWGHPTTRKRFVHERANYPRTRHGGFRCPTCARLGWYAEGILPDPTLTNNTTGVTP